MGVSNGRYRSFLVRVWSRKGHFVHGEVTDASTRESVRFREFPRLLRFILAGLRHSDDEPLAEPEDELAVISGRAAFPTRQGSGPQIWGAGRDERPINAGLTGPPYGGDIGTPVP